MQFAKTGLPAKILIRAAGDLAKQSRADVAKNGESVLYSAPITLAKPQIGGECCPCADDSNAPVSNG